MPTELAYKPSSKFLILVAGALLLTLGGGLLIMWYQGSFTTPAIKKEVAPAYRIAYVPHAGPIEKLNAIFEDVKAQLHKVNIEPGDPCTLILDDNSVPEANRRSKIGFIVGRNDYIPAPLEVEEFPSRDALIATFDGGARMGSYLSYQAMIEWAKKYGYTLSLPALEIYHPDAPNEYQLGISKGSKNQ